VAGEGDSEGQEVLGVMEAGPGGEVARGGVAVEVGATVAEEVVEQAQAARVAAQEVEEVEACGLEEVEGSASEWWSCEQELH
jgi:hypothetical protein